MILEIFVMSGDKMTIYFIFGYLKSLVARFVNQVIKNCSPNKAIRVVAGGKIRNVPWLIINQLISCD